MMPTPPVPNGHSPRTFFQTLIRTLPLHVLVTTSIVGGAALFYSLSVSNRGTWTMLGSWSLTALYILIGLVGGTVAGVLDASRQMVERLEQALRDLVHTLPALNRSADTIGRDLSAVRQEYETLVDHSVAQAGRRLRLPQWLERLIRAGVRGLVVDRFIASCTSRGVHAVAPQEFRNWLLAEGVSLGFMPVLDQLAWWRYLLLGSLLLLTAIALALAFLTT
ncbi:MAG TPA: hypothetical protein PKW52_01715 [Nitrospira sp.]|nr:hypothetical protein [Nitrospira sp. NTP1]HQR15079.1 hypothetical protein [Nitrospira sp.]HQV10030.1 hypothetical protein [Nitrospira sp.]